MRISRYLELCLTLTKSRDETLCAHRSRHLMHSIYEMFLTNQAVVSLKRKKLQKGVREIRIQLMQHAFLFVWSTELDT